MITHHDDAILPGAADRGTKPLVGLLINGSSSVVVVAGRIERYNVTSTNKYYQLNSFLQRQLLLFTAGSNNKCMDV